MSIFTLSKFKVNLPWVNLNFLKKINVNLKHAAVDYEPEEYNFVSNLDMCDDNAI